MWNFKEKKKPDVRLNFYFLLSDNKIWKSQY